MLFPKKRIEVYILSSNKWLGLIVPSCESDDLLKNITLHIARMNLFEGVFLEIFKGLLEEGTSVISYKRVALECALEVLIKYEMFCKIALW